MNHSVVLRSLGDAELVRLLAAGEAYRSPVIHELLGRLQRYIDSPHAAEQATKTECPVCQAPLVVAYDEDTDQAHLRI